MTIRFPLSLVLCLVLFTLSHSPRAQPPQGDAAPIDPEPHLSFQFGPTQRFGLIVLKDQAGKPVNKQLTFSPAPYGWTNTTVVQIDKKDFEFGGPAGKWVEKETKFANGSKSVWALNGIEVSQILEIVPSNQPVEVAPGVRKRLLDTCLIRYVIENKDDQNHAVGLRILVDTLIGMNDGVPFAVPPLKELVTTQKDFPTAKDVPEFVQALEVPDLLKPGTVGLMTLKAGGGMEAPSRVSLTHWPGRDFTAWNVPLANMGTDSAVVLYWNPDHTLKPSEKRNLGFAYGLGRVSSGEGTGKLALTVNGTFRAGEPFTVSAYVQDPVKDQTLKLELPAGLNRVEGKETESVQPPSKDSKDTKNTSIITWKLMAPKPGQFKVKVTSSNGVAQTQQVTIREGVKTDAGKLLALTISGPLAVGKVFNVTATVKHPLPDQHLTLSLPTGLERMAPEERQPAAPAGHSDVESAVAWKIKALKAGDFKIEVHSSIGGMVSKSVSIPEPKTEPKIEPKPKPELKKDLTVEDARRALQMSVGNLPQDLILDVDGDGRVTSLDAALILQMVLERTRKEK